ncbi:MAG: AAA-like domain-containing protein, partial [Mastigocoleus sp. MO_167.B18]|nr:AAA-like domain-containing protein [Mastigocoleus sp. MO_167.B18]
MNIFNDMNISGQQSKKLTNALMDAFPDKASLEQMLSYELDKNLDSIAGGSNLQVIVFNLIKVSKAENWIEDLIGAARSSNPGNTSLKAVSDEFLANHCSEADTNIYLDPNIYIERPPIEEKCLKGILRLGALIRIKAAQKMGKTLLLEKLLEHARQQGYQTAKLDLKLADKSTLTDLKSFLQWLCVDVSDILDKPPNLNEYWQDSLGLNTSCTRYFQRYLLAKTDNPIVLAIDNFERLFQCENIFPEFCLLLRSWYETAKQGDRMGKIWRKLRLVVVNSTELYPTLDINRSPFNVGLAVELPDFNQNQVQEMVNKYELDRQLGEQDIIELMGLVGGHPYLLQEVISSLGSQ